MATKRLLHASGRRCASAVLLSLLIVPATPGATAQKGSKEAPPQISLPIVEEMPNMPQPFKMRDWKQVARDFDALVFDLDAKGEYFPLVWIDQSHINFDEDTFGLYVTVGDPRCGPKVNRGEYHDALNDIPAVIGAALVGIDKRNQKGRNWAAMCKAYFNRVNGRNVVLQNQREFDAWKIGGGYQIDFWQDTFANIAFFQLVDCYPLEPRFEEIMRIVADQFHKASAILKDSGNGFRYSVFDWKNMKPIKNRITPQTGQPDVAGAYAWLQYMAYVKFKDPRYLRAAEWAMELLTAEKKNPRYDALLPYGVYTAARINAELGHDFDTAKLLNWCFTRDSEPWPATKGPLTGRFGNYDISGVWGLSYKGNDRAYLFETFQMAGAIVPVVRYDPRFARAIGKWMLNAANAARLFYPEELPDANQSAPEYKSLVRNAIGYEALTIRNNAPYAERDPWQSQMDDGTPYVFPKASQFSLYGSAHAGIFGGMISRTTDEKILQLDCLKTDFFHGRAYPTYLYFNPHAEEKTIRIDVGKAPLDLYDSVSKRFVGRKVSGRAPLRLAADSAAVVVWVPSGGKITRRGSIMSVNGIAVDFRAGE